MTTTILFTALPLLVSGATALLKRLPTVQNSGSRSSLIRAIAAVLSLGGAVGLYMTTGVLPDPTQLGDLISVALLGFVNFLGATGWYSLIKKK